MRTGFFIYKYVKDGQIIYLGKTKRPLNQRINEHKHKNAGRAAEESGKQKFRVADSRRFAGFVLFRFFLKAQHKYAVKVYGEYINDYYDIKQCGHIYTCYGIVCPRSVKL